MSRIAGPRTGYFLACLLMMASLMVGGRPGFADDQAMVLPTDPVPLVAETASGRKTFTIEVADETSERTAGLMFRQTMPDDHGMLFVFEQTEPVQFWMKNTVMPLDLLFVGQDGKVRAIKHGKPYSEDVIAPDEPVRFVLELKAGTAAKSGIADGDRLVHPAISQAPGAGNSAPDKPSAPPTSPSEGAASGNDG